MASNPFMNVGANVHGSIYSNGRFMVIKRFATAWTVVDERTNQVVASNFSKFKNAKDAAKAFTADATT